MGKATAARAPPASIYFQLTPAAKKMQRKIKTKTSIVPKSPCLKISPIGTAACRQSSRMFFGLLRFLRTVKQCSEKVRIKLSLRNSEGWIMINFRSNQLRSSEPMPSPPRITPSGVKQSRVRSTVNGACSFQRLARV